MRFLLAISLDTDLANDAIRDGSIGETMEQILADIKPEAAFFGLKDGTRGVYLIVNITDGSQMPAVAEPFFLAFGATIDAIPIFNIEELGKAMSAIGLVVQKYG